MKNLFKKIAILSIAMLVFGCSKDDDSSSPSCVPIACLNGGTSKPDCGCDCPNGYSGSNCGIKLAPSKIFISKITVTRFPNIKSDGSYWDPFSGIPDISVALGVQISSGTYAVVWSAPTYYEDVVSSGTNSFEFIPEAPIVVSNPQTPYLIQLTDYDAGSTDDIMGEIPFYFYSSDLVGFPTTLVVTDDSINMQVKFTVSYQW